MTQSATLSGSPQESVALVDNKSADDVIYGMTLTSWFKVITISAVMIGTFYYNLVRLWLKTNPFTGELNWRHSVCVPIIGLYYLYVNRDELRRAKVKPSWTGLAILIVGLLLFAFAIWPGQNDFLKDFGMVVTLFGVVLLLCGWDVMKIAWFPIAFLVCAIPWPELVYSYVASPLQHLAASVAVGTMRLTGVEANNFGTKINILGKDNNFSTLNVAEACAGLRSLMTFISVGGAVAFLSLRPMWQKILITVSGIPIAIFCNVMRVSGQGLLDRYVSHQWSQGFAHQFAGIVMLVPGFLLILFVGWFLDQIFVEVAEDAPRPKRSIIKAPTAAVNWSSVAPAAAASKAGAPASTVTPAPVAKQAVAAKPPAVSAPPANVQKPAVPAKPTAVPVPAKPAGVAPPKAVQPAKPAGNAAPKTIQTAKAAAAATPSAVAKKPPVASPPVAKAPSGSPAAPNAAPAIKPIRRDQP
jgi:exosortase